MSKAELRAWARALRDRVPAATRAEASAAITRIIDERYLGALSPGDVIALFAAMGSEIDLRDLDARAHARGLRVAYPRVIRGERPLRFHLATLDELKVATFGVREPDASAPPIAAGALALVVVPGLAFTAAGARLGWGAGHYDATLAGSGARAIGVALAGQLVDVLPETVHDRRVERVITERGIAGETNDAGRAP